VDDNPYGHPLVRDGATRPATTRSYTQGRFPSASLGLRLCARPPHDGVRLRSV